MSWSILMKTIDFTEVCMSIYCKDFFEEREKFLYSVWMYLQGIPIENLSSKMKLFDLVMKPRAIDKKVHKLDKAVGRFRLKNCTIPTSVRAKFLREHSTIHMWFGHGSSAVIL